MLTKPVWGPQPEQATPDKMNRDIEYGQTVHGRAVADAAPGDGQALVWNESTETWEPGDVEGGSTDADTLDSQDGSYYLARVNHTGTQPLSSISDAGTSAALDVAASGDAAAGEVVKGNDTRLSDNRTPTSHAATHRPGGSDAISTAAASGLANTNAEGSSTSLARADHTHKRDVRVLSAGSAVGTRNALNFTGAGVSVTDDSANDRVIIDIPGDGPGSDSKVDVYADGVASGSTARALNFDDSDFDITEDGANDRYDVELADELDSNARVAIRVNSDASDTGARRRINLIEGTGIEITAVDDSGDEEIDVTINSTATAGSKHVIQEEGTSQTARANLNFIGDAVTASDDAGNDATNVTIDAYTTAQADVLLNDKADAVPLVVALTDAATIDTNAAAAEAFRVSSATDRILGVPTNAVDGLKRIWYWKNTDSAQHQLTLAPGTGGFLFTLNVDAMPATTAGHTAVIGAQYDDTLERWVVLAYNEIVV